MEVDVEVDLDVDVGVGVVEVEEDDDDVVVVVEVDDDDDDELDAAAPGFPMIPAEATAGPVVLIEATEVPSGRGKKSSGLVLSQQTFDAFRLWSQHQFPPWFEH